LKTSNFRDFLIKSKNMIRELDLRSLWKELDEYDIEMEKEVVSLQEVWTKIALLKEKNEQDDKE
jgi:fumarate reductase subunit C